MGLIRQGSKHYDIVEAVLHTAAIVNVKAFLEQFPTVQMGRAEIDRWHKARGFKMIGYHLLVYPDGSWIACRPPEMIGAHVIERNRGTLGICMINVRPHNGITRFEDYFTEAQRRTVKWWIASMVPQTKLQWVTGHNDYANRECPGFKVRDEDWLPAKKFIPVLPPDYERADPKLQQSSRGVWSWLRRLWSGFF